MNLGRYEILREVGRGSMGVVYQARDPMIDRLVAVKVLRQDPSAGQDFAQRFLKEAKAIGRLSHPGIVTIYDVESDGGSLYIAMEYLEGVPLADLIHHGGLGIEDALRYGVQIAETLDYAHRQGVIHRDIKPSNIIVAPDGTLHITDFGIARIEDASMTLQTQAGMILGTPAYMSPEQALGKPVDRRSDIFSVGVMLYEMIVGRRPFGQEGATLASVLANIVSTTPQEPCSLSASIPQNISALIMKAIGKNPVDRFQTGHALAAQLKTCLAGMTEPVASRRRAKRPVLIALTGILIVSWAYFFYAQWKDEPKIPIPTAPVEQNAPEPAAIPASPPPAVLPVEPKTVPLPTPSQETPEMPQAPAVAMPLPAATEAPSLPTPQSTEQPEPVPPQPLTEKKETPKAVAAIPPVPKKATPPKPVATPKEAVKPKPKPKPTPAPRKVVPLVPVMLRSSPSGARIYIDGRLKGTTPTTLMLSTGAHGIRASLPGYQDARRRITIAETMEYPLVFKLKAVGQP